MCVLRFFSTFRNECYLNIFGEKYGYVLLARSQKDLEELLLKTMFGFFIDHTLIFIILKHTNTHIILWNNFGISLKDNLQDLDQKMVGTIYYKKLFK